MGLQNQPFVQYPWQDYPSEGNSNFGSFNMSEGDAGAFVVIAPAAGNLEKIYVGALMTPDETPIVIQGILDDDGTPDGSTIVTGILYNGSGMWGTIELDDPLAVTRGQKLCVLMEPESVGGAGDVFFGYTNTIANCYVLRRFGATWTKLGGSDPNRAPVLICEYEGGQILPIPGVAVCEFGIDSITLTSTSDEIALRFRFPFASRCVGMGFYGEAQGLNGARFDLVLYSGTTPLETTTVFNRGTVDAPVNRQHIGLFEDGIEIDPNTVFRAAVKPTSTSQSGVDIGYVVEQQSSGITDHMNALLGGKELHYSERVNGGAWTDNALKRPAIFLILEAFHDGNSLWLFNPTAGTITPFEG